MLYHNNCTYYSLAVFINEGTNFDQEYLHLVTMKLTHIKADLYRLYMILHDLPDLTLKIWYWRQAMAGSGHLRILIDMRQLKQELLNGSLGLMSLFCNIHSDDT